MRRSYTDSRRLSTSIGICAVSLALAASVHASGKPGNEGLAAIAQRLHDGDRSAIEELLARTRKPTIELPEAMSRVERLRSEIEVLRTRRGARPSFPLPTVQAPDDVASSMDESTRVDGLREARAWLRAGEPEEALRAVPDEGEEALYLEARALEGLGRRDEALATYRRVAQEATSNTLRTRAASDVEHLEWRARIAVTRGGRP